MSVQMGNGKKNVGIVGDGRGGEETKCQWEVNS